MTNKAVQLQDKDGNNIFPLGIMGGSHTQMTLLWTNPNPSASFGYQTVSIDLSNYDLVGVSCSRNAGAEYKNIEFVKVGNGGASNYLLSYKNIVRTFSVSTTGVQFDEGAINNPYGTGSIDNTVCIPYQIYGIKLNEQNITGTSTDVDFIVEQGTSGIWTYRKWNSGIAELFGRKDVSANIATSFGSLYKVGLSVPTFPFNFTSILAKNYCVESDKCFAIGDVTSGGTVYLVTGTAQIVYTFVTFEIKGRWK